MNTPYLWLQPDEEVATAGCGCRLEVRDGSERVHFCPLHTLAEELHKEAVGFVTDGVTGELLQQNPNLHRAWTRIRNVLEQIHTQTHGGQSEESKPL